MTTADPYEMWDGAYVLGALSSSERRVYEAHLGGCSGCRAAVSELSGMPALLALLDRAEMAAPGWDDDTTPEVPPLRAEVLDGLLAKVRARRRRYRWVTGAVAAVAAAVLAVGVLIAVRPGAEDPVVPTTMTMAAVMPSELTATFTLTGRDWGTDIAVTCTYLHSDTGSHDGRDGDAGDKLSMVALGRDGSRVQLGTWMAHSGATAVASGSTAMPVDEIASVQVISADTGDVLLQRNL